MSAPFMHSFSELADFIKLKAIMHRVAPGAKSFYVISIRKNETEENQLADVLMHCRRIGYTVKRHTRRYGQPCVVASK